MSTHLTSWPRDTKGELRMGLNKNTGDTCAATVAGKFTLTTRRCLAAEFGAREWENGGVLTKDDVGSNVDFWDNPLKHEEGDRNHMQLQGVPHYCAGGPSGWWYVRFKDRRKHKVSEIRLWNREQGPQERLNNACVRFSFDGAKPSSEDPTQNCDMYLPEIAFDSGPGSGTYVPVDEMIVGMMLISQADPTYLTLCGIEIYEETTGNLPRYPALQAAGCVVQEKAAYHNFDRPGNQNIPHGTVEDSSGNRRPATSLPECVQLCTQDDECVGILYSQGASACMLKSDGAFADGRKQTGGFHDAFDSVQLPKNSACRDNVAAMDQAAISTLNEDALRDHANQDSGWGNVPLGCSVQSGADYIPY
eukprot:g12401.t1